MSRSLIVLPDDSSKPLIDAIHGATSSLRIKMFVFSDPSLLDAVIAARNRGVEVRVMLNRGAGTVVIQTVRRPPEGLKAGYLSAGQ